MIEQINYDIEVQDDKTDSYYFCVNLLIVLTNKYVD